MIRASVTYRFLTPRINPDTGERTVLEHWQLQVRCQKLETRWLDGFYVPTYPRWSNWEPIGPRGGNFEYTIASRLCAMREQLQYECGRS